MIQIDMTRHNGELFVYPPRFESVQRALRSLVEFELGFGGRVVDATPTRIEVHTSVLACRDTAVFSGTAEDMRLLVEVVAYMTVIENERADLVSRRTVDQLMATTHGNPFQMMCLTPLVFGNVRPLRLAVMLAYGISDEETLRAGNQTKLGDLLSALELTHECGCTLNEALAA